MAQQIANQSLHLFLERLVQSQLKLAGVFPENLLWPSEDKQYVSAYVFLISFCSHAGTRRKGKPERVQASAYRGWGAAETRAEYPISVLRQIVHACLRTSTDLCYWMHGPCFRPQILPGHRAILYRSKVLPRICPKAPAAPSMQLQETSALRPGFSFS